MLKIAHVKDTYRRLKKMADTKKLVEAENYLSNALLLKPAPLPLGRSGVADVSNE